MMFLGGYNDFNQVMVLGKPLETLCHEVAQGNDVGEQSLDLESAEGSR